MLRLVPLAVALGVLGCSAGPARPSQTAAGPTAILAPKVITVAQATAVKSYTLRDFSNPSGGGAALVELHTAGLVSQDPNGNPEGRLALQLPSLTDGTVNPLPDGRMETTWKLRPNVLWHDGVPFTADDIVFSLEAARRLDLLSSTAAPIRQVDGARATDPLTAGEPWK